LPNFLNTAETITRPGVRPRRRSSARAMSITRTRSRGALEACATQRGSFAKLKEDEVLRWTPDFSEDAFAALL
jgi:hypothetical protein